jgi:hypothetical protein
MVSPVHTRLKFDACLDVRKIFYVGTDDEQVGLSLSQIYPAAHHQSLNYQTFLKSGEKYKRSTQTYI